jgi:hypothetical protein
MDGLRVLALNGSPRGGDGVTSRMIGPLLEGMQDAGATTELIRLRKLKLRHCTGCYTCWVHTPGACIHRDGMDRALEAWSRADLVVLGTPVYHGSMTGLMKTFLDRLLPRYEPWLVPHPTIEGATGHPARGPEPRRFVLVSPCGFPGLHNFDALVHTVRHIARMHSAEVCAEILRPFGEPLRLKALQGLFAGYFADLETAGREIITAGAISDTTQQRLHRDLLPGGPAEQWRMANDHWSRLRREAGPATLSPAGT